MFETTVRYNNPNNKHPIETHPELYDSVLFQGHYLAHATNALPSLIRKLVTEEQVDYYIDPMVNDFRKGTNFRDGNGGLRQWHAKLVSYLGDPLEDILTQNAVATANPRNLDDESIEAIARSVIRFQENIVPEEVEDNKYTTSAADRRDLQPKAAVSWGHKITRDEDIEILDQIIRHSEDEADIELKPLIFTTHQYIRNPSNRGSILSLFRETDVSECFLAIEDLHKHEVFEPEYGAVVDLVYDLAENNVSPHFYAGDYFANLLSYFGLGGSTHGTLYGEEFSEDFESTEGGGLAVRYYVDEVKDFLKPVAAADVYQQTQSDMCDCKFCDRQFDSWADLVKKSQDEDENLFNSLQKHYLTKRWNHSRQVEQLDIDDSLQNLEDDRDEFITAYKSSDQISPGKELDYMFRWQSVIEDRREDLL